METPRESTGSTTPSSDPVARKDSIVGPLTNPSLPRTYTAKQAIDYAVHTIGRGARLGHQTRARLQRLKVVGPGRETVPRDNDPPLIQLIIAIANEAEECLTADAGEKGSDLDRRKARLTGLKAAFDCIKSGYEQITTMAQAHIRLVQEAKKLDQMNRHHEDEMALKHKMLLEKGSKAGREAAELLDSALQSMSNDEIERYRTTSTDTTTEP